MSLDRLDSVLSRLETAENEIRALKSELSETRETCDLLRSKLSNHDFEIIDVKLQRHIDISRDADVEIDAKLEREIEIRRISAEMHEIIRKQKLFEKEFEAGNDLINLAFKRQDILESSLSSFKKNTEVVIVERTQSGLSARLKTDLKEEQLSFRKRNDWDHYSQF